MIPLALKYAMSGFWLGVAGTLALGILAGIIYLVIHWRLDQ